MDAPSIKWVLKRRECSGFARVNKVTSASLGYPLSVFNKNSTLKATSIKSAKQARFDKGGGCCGRGRGGGRSGVFFKGAAVAAVVAVVVASGGVRGGGGGGGGGVKKSSRKDAQYCDQD